MQLQFSLYVFFLGFAVRAKTWVQCPSVCYYATCGPTNRPGSSFVLIEAQVNKWPSSRPLSFWAHEWAKVILFGLRGL